MNQKVYAEIDKLRNRELVAEYPYVYADGIHCRFGLPAALFSIPSARPDLKAGPPAAVAAVWQPGL